ncbi:SDR family oxidoreductase [Allorhizobium taibaishanense]|uniref:3-ketoacyl-ACP reductase n=1 Tax=Allorhizobium taibaishanense TaxID=887144 RepID=A0A1Q9A8Y4_9HYPH|nr:SDR family oxidoreductase [Allorhizobium taibaishanense]MBB4009443.1 3-oxoacyl-[acyl-carrier protein] reductase [Allorhizobium taibaishanense]OLP51017.1 3-ketoacyl-ACP reductase [Allorhizobium taibaishanense]
MTGQRLAIVTGAARGIGAAIARRLASDGCTVLVSDLDGDGAELLAGEILTSGGAAFAAQADIADPATFPLLFDKAEAIAGGVDILVNNAGIMVRRPMAEIDDAMFERQIAVNLNGTFFGMREAARRMREGGRVVNISSSVAAMRTANYSIYAATKSAIETMTSILAKELRGRTITVNAIAPGATATDLFLDGKTPDAVGAFAKLAPLERIGTPEEIAAAVAFLAGPEGGWINGQTIHANGGVI